MDFLSVCRSLKLSPWLTAILEIDIANLKDDEVTDLVSCAKASKLHYLYQIDGSYMSKVLLEFDDAGFSKAFGKQDSCDISFGQDKYKVESLYAILKSQNKASADPKPDSYKKSFTRKIKHFSGKEPIGPGECGVSEWMVLAQDVVDHDSKLTNKEKLDFLRSTLISDALQLLSTCLDDIQDGQSLINLIARTYGGAVSTEQLEYEFRQTTQLDREKPSMYWARLQQALVKWDKSTKSNIKYDSLRLCQFVWGLCPTDSDLLGVRLKLDSLVSAKEYPEYGDFLEKLQVIERERRERGIRAGHNKVRSGLVNLEEGLSEIESLKLKVAQLSTQASQEMVQETVNVANMTATSQVAQNPHKQRYQESKPKGPRSKGQKKKKPCWNCEATDHHLARCPAEFDASKVGENFQNFRDSKAKKSLN